MCIVSITMNYTVSITSKGQMTIPKELRDLWGLKAPSRVVVSGTKNGTMSIRNPVPLQDIHKLLGKPMGRPNLTEREKIIVPQAMKKYLKNAG